jgi:hypothetical protein
MACDWRVCQPVICVDGDFSPSWYEGDEGDNVSFVLPKKGSIYTIRSISPFTFPPETVIAIRLHEIVNPIVEFDDGEVCEIAFWVGRFRPVINAERDLAVFEAILRDVNAREVVEA